MADAIASRILRSLIEQPNANCSELQRRLGAGYSVYAVLVRLVDSGLITTSGWSDTTPAKGGRRRKLYAITDAGREAEMQQRHRLPEAADV
jgi:DNA-binding PadR family transcriptional regulator